MSIPISAGGTLAAPAPAAVRVPVVAPKRAVAGLHRWLQRPRLFYVLGALALVVLAGVVVRHLMTRPPPVATIDTEAVSRHDISQSVEATGTVQAINVVEIKSKASGQILKMPVVIGSVVKAGDLLVQIDPLTVRNQYAQALAAQRSATAQVQVATTQQQRADTLFSREAITATEHEAAVLAIASAKASLAKAGSDLQIAKQALDDATVRAPSAGRIVEQDATNGMVITSATSSASGGTTILKMADLNHVEISALVAETDVGNLAPGMRAKVTVDAFPNRPFPGQVTMIEPQAVVQQSVTLFPVLVAIDNVNGALLPGMNGEVTIAIANRTQVLAVPLDAIRTVREAPTVALSLGLNADSLTAQLRRQLAARQLAQPKAAPATAPPGAAAPAAGARHRTGGAAHAGGAKAGAAGGSAAQAQFVMVHTATGFEPRLVAIGISDFDYSEVLSGVQEGEQVTLLSVAEQAAKRKAQQAQISQRMGSGLPGSTGSGGGTRAGGGGR